MYLLISGFLHLEVYVSTEIKFTLLREVHVFTEIKSPTKGLFSVLQKKYTVGDKYVQMQLKIKEHHIKAQNTLKAPDHLKHRLLADVAFSKKI